MATSRPVLFALILTGGVPALAQSLLPETPQVDFDRGRDFSRDKTYAWHSDQVPLPNLAHQVWLTRAVERELGAKGLTRAEPGMADLYVRCYARIEKKVRGTAYEGGSTWAPTNLRTIVDIGRVEEGTLILELCDGHTKEVVWRAILKDRVPRPDLVEDAIKDGVKRLLAPYPPKAP